MTYCLGIITAEGLVMASDSRTNAGFDQITVARKLTTFVIPGERAFCLLASGSLSLTQSIVTLLQRDFDQGLGLATVKTMYEAAREVGKQVRDIDRIDREALARDKFQFNVHFILGGQIGNQPHDLYLIYPQGNPLRATKDSPYLQTGEHKYGRPILVRGIRYDTTPLNEAARYAVISMDSTMRSNVTVGPPVDLVIYRRGELEITSQRRLTANDPDFIRMHTQWDDALRMAVHNLPDIDFDTIGQKSPDAVPDPVKEDSIVAAEVPAGVGASS